MADSQILTFDPDETYSSLYKYIWVLFVNHVLLNILRHKIHGVADFEEKCWL